MLFVAYDVCRILMFVAYEVFECVAYRVCRSAKKSFNIIYVCNKYFYIFKEIN